jgi:hypothetical protein
MVGFQYVYCQVLLMHFPSVGALNNARTVELQRETPVDNSERTHYFGENILDKLLLISPKSHGAVGMNHSDLLHLCLLYLLTFSSYLRAYTRGSDLVFRSFLIAKAELIKLSFLLVL